MHRFFSVCFHPACLFDSTLEYSVVWVHKQKQQCFALSLYEIRNGLIFACTLLVLLISSQESGILTIHFFTAIANLPILFYELKFISNNQFVASEPPKIMQLNIYKKVNL